MAPKLARQWNQPAVNALNTPQARVSAKDVAKSAGFSALIAFCSIKLASAGSAFFAPETAAYYALVVFMYTAAALFGLACLKLAIAVPEKLRPPKWMRELSDAQRALLGLAGPAKAPPAQAGAANGKAPAAKAAPGVSPLGPPKRTAPIPAPPADSAALSTAAALTEASPLARGSAAAGLSPYSPYSSSLAQRGVSTPQQLAAVLDDFDRQAQPATPAQELGYAAYGQDGMASSAFGMQGGGMAPTPYLPSGSAFLQSAAAAQEAAQMLQGGGAAGGGALFGAAAPGSQPRSSPLPAASPSPGPGYRPAYQQPAGAAVSPLLRPTAAEPGRMALSSPEQLAAVLQTLAVDRGTLETWTERLREWFAAAVLQPLVAKVEGAHTRVVEAAARLAWTGVQLSPLGGQVAAGREADDEVLIRQMREALQQRLATQPHVQAAETAACLQAVNDYVRLAWLLRGEHPRALLPPTPQGYIMSRVRTLAEGPCVREFRWNGGGPHEGRPWTAELPSDAALLLYLFAAYLEAPGWAFPDDPRLDANGAPLYLGQLPTRPVPGYYAVLSTRPPATPQSAAALLGLGLGSAAPAFGLALSGELVATLSSGSALFTALLLFVQAAARAGGSLGGRSLAVLGLADVVAPVGPSYSLSPGRWFGLF